jgi:glycosyltransferase involved in cell wall biosynthesis
VADRRPVMCVLLTPGMGGPHAWALRLRRRLATTHRVLIGCAGAPGGIVTDPDHCFDGPEALGAWLQSVSPAIVLPNWLWDCYEVCDLVKATGADLRVIGYCRSDDEDTYYGPLSRHHRSCDWLVAVSEACRDGLLQRLPARSDRIRLIRTFVEGPAVLTRSWRTEPVRILYSGRLEQHHKRVLDLPVLAEGLMQRGVQFELAIAGQGDSGFELRRRTSQLAHGGHVRFLGELTPEEVSQHYLASEIVVLVSDTEGLSNSVLEGMAHGCVPVVTRISRELSDLLVGPLAGGVVDVGATDDMAAWIAWLAETPERLRSRGMLARRATARYFWPTYERAFTSFLADVLAA